MKKLMLLALLLVLLLGFGKTAGAQEYVQNPYTGE